MPSKRSGSSEAKRRERGSWAAASPVRTQRGRACRNEVAGRPHQKIREVGTPRQPRNDPLGESRPADPQPDQPLQHPLSRERGATCPAVRRERRAPHRPAVPERRRDRVRRELRATQRAVDALARERIEEVRRVTDEQCPPFVGNRRARPLGEGPGYEHLAHQTAGVEATAQPGEPLQLREPRGAIVPPPPPPPPPPSRAHPGEGQDPGHRRYAPPYRPPPPLGPSDHHHPPPPLPP